MVNYTLKINKNIKESKVLFDADIDENIIKIISTDKYDYALIEVVEGTNVTYTILCDGYETISNTIFTNNSGRANGSAIYYRGQTIINASSFINNSASDLI